LTHRDVPPLSNVLDALNLSEADAAGLVEVASSA
jgi:hypothetical protein